MFTFPISLFNNTITSTDYSSTILSFNPTIYWRLEETSGTVAVDSSGNNNTGTLSGSYTLNQTGSLTNSSKSISFTNGEVRQPANITIPASGYTVIIRAKTSATFPGICFFTNGTSNAPSLAINNSKAEFGYFTTIHKFITSTINYNDNLWHSYAFSVGSAGAKLYVDGNLIGSNAADTTTLSFSGTWVIAKATSGRGVFTALNGSLDEFAYFTTQLTDGNISTIHLAV